MGEAKRKKQRFLATHPYCCFCGGGEPATTVDHIPARTCFAERAAPESFEFPACESCQAATRLDELAFGMFVRINDPNTENYRREEMLKAIEGVRNNLPHLLPFGLSAREKRRALRHVGLAKPDNMLASEIPIVAVPAAIDPHVHRYARKLAAALYYREKEKAMGPDFVVWTDWGQAADQRQIKAFLEIAGMSPHQSIGSRRNLKFGDRFGYRCNKSDENDLFMAIAQFGRGLIMVMLVADGESAKELEEDDWVPVSAMFA